MRSTLSLIGSSWDFFRRQPALISVGFWMLFLPMLGIDALGSLHDQDAIPADIRAGATLGIILLMLVLSVITIWGQCCVMVAGKRMLQTNAGRSRTSFNAVASQAKSFVIPFILTNILRGCITLLWTLLLVVPGIIYAIRTIFVPVVVVGENTAYRAALRRSMDAVKGNGWKIFGVLALLVIFLFVLPYIVMGAAALPLPVNAISKAGVRVISDAWSAGATIVFNLCLIRMYEQYRKPAGR